MITSKNELIFSLICSQMSSGLKERLKRCGRYHSSPTMGQNAQKRTHFTSPLLATADQHGAKQTLEKEKGEEKSQVSVSADSKSMDVRSPSYCSLDTKKLHTSDPDSGHKTASLSGLVRPHRLDFSQDHPVCDKMASSSIMSESANSETQEQGKRRQQLQASIKEKEDVLRKLRLVQFYQNKVCQISRVI